MLGTCSQPNWREAPPADLTPQVDETFRLQANTVHLTYSGRATAASDSPGLTAIVAQSEQRDKSQFTGQGGHSYSFYARATDGVGHLEVAPLLTDAEIWSMHTVYLPLIVRQQGP